ncbi:hypothetical protein OROMI_001583 [Orobanche minor]
MSAPVIDRNDAVTGHIISTTIGGKNGEHKQTVSYMAERVVGTGLFGVVFQIPRVSSSIPNNSLSINQRSPLGSNNNNDMKSQPKQLNLKALRSTKELYNIRSSQEHQEQEHQKQSKIPGARTPEPVKK